MRAGGIARSKKKKNDPKKGELCLETANWTRFACRVRVTAGAAGEDASEATDLVPRKQKQASWTLSFFERAAHGWKGLSALETGRLTTVRTC